MNINSNATSAIVDGVFRLVRDGSALCVLVSAWHRGAAGATGKQTALYAFGSLSLCFGVGLHGADASRTRLLWLALPR